jgi:hypothetical protein
VLAVPPVATLLAPPVGGLLVPPLAAPLVAPVAAPLAPPDVLGAPARPPVGLVPPVDALLVPPVAAERPPLEFRAPPAPLVVGGHCPLLETATHSPQSISPCPHFSPPSSSAEVLQPKETNQTRTKLTGRIRMTKTGSQPGTAFESDHGLGA